VNFNQKQIRIEEATSNQLPDPTLSKAALQDMKKCPQPKGQLFELAYDKLVVAVGCYSQTFGTPGVRENAFFLKDVMDARKIRYRVLECVLSLIRKSLQLDTDCFRFRDCFTSNIF